MNSIWPHVWPDLLRLLRLACGLVLIYLGGKDRPRLSLLVLAIGQLSDPLDGHVARATGAWPPLLPVDGWLDLGADTCLTFGSLMALVRLKVIPWSLVGLLALALALGQFALQPLVGFPIVFIGAILTYCALTYVYFARAKWQKWFWAYGAFCAGYIYVVDWPRITHAVDWTWLAHAF